MSEGTVRQWCRMLKYGETNVYDKERSGLPSIMSDDCVQGFDKKISKRCYFTVSELLCEFP
jgi:hypothetical protein